MENEDNIKKILKITTIIILIIAIIMSTFDILYFIGKSNIHILNITLTQYSSIIKTIGYNMAIIVIPCILFTCLIYSLLLIGIIWFIFYYIKSFKYSLYLTKNNNQKGKILLITYILLLILIIISILVNLF